MDTKLNQLLDLYLQNKFQPGTGSEDWWNLKTEVLVVDDFIVGSTLHESLKEIDQKQLPYFYKRLSEVSSSIDNYNTVDEDEAKERVLVQLRVKYGLEILNYVAKELNIYLNQSLIMQKLKIALMAALMTIVSVLTAIVPTQVRASTSWQSTLVVSSAQARFEVVPTGYDSASNKYKYQFSWLIPARRIYSFKIDGKIYNARVTQNGTVETPFWFSPNITYTIQIFPYANDQGTMLAEGTFMAPALAKPLTKEEEYALLYQYVEEAPAYPTKRSTSKTDYAAIMALLNAEATTSTYQDTIPYISSKSVELFSKTPLLIAELDEAARNSPNGPSTDIKIKVLQGNMHAIIKVKSKNLETNKYETQELFVIKENGSWKLDIIQIIKNEASKY